MLIQRGVRTFRVQGLNAITRSSPVSLLSFGHHQNENGASLLPSYCQMRGAKRKSSLKINDLSQGPLSAAPLEDLPADDAPTYPSVVQGHLNNVKKFNGCVVLTRVGNFYELYAEQAERYGPLLNLKVAQRRTSLGNVAMSGFQYFQLDRYLKLLVQDLNMPVAISDEIRNSPSEQVQAGGLMYNRKVTRVITAGTLIDETFVDPYENNFLLSIHIQHPLANSSMSTQPTAQPRDGDDVAVVGLSWIDLSSGDFFTQETSLDGLSSAVARIAPREVLLDAALEDIDPARLKQFLGDGHYTLTHHKSGGWFSNLEEWNDVIDRPLSPETRFTDSEFAAASLILDYVQSKLQNLRVALRTPVRRTDDDSMRIDRYSLRGLEIKETMRDGFSKGSLLHSIKRTVTKSGSRALTQRIMSPSMSVNTINSRLDTVEELLEHEELFETVQALLQQTFDTPRLLVRFSIGRGDADDLLGIGKTIDLIGRLFDYIRDHPPTGVRSDRLGAISEEIVAIDMNKLFKLAERIRGSIDEEGLQRQHSAERAEAEQLEEFAEEVEESEGTSKRPRKPSSKDTSRDQEDDGEIWVMKRDANSTLARIHNELTDKFQAKQELLSHLRESLGMKSITLKWHPNTRHFCHVKGKDCRVSVDGAINISSTKSTRTFALPAWTALGKEIDEVKLRIRAEEQRIFARLRDEVLSNLVKLRRCSSILDDLDIACSSAQLAKERSLVRPILHDGTTHNIVGGRHPMVDAGLHESGRSFTSNNCTMGTDEQIMLITGPNMAGKSTYLRQNALISILAQTGCYVPAEYAEIGLVDRIFSRVGSADNLYNHQSTFMVEMIEVAEILNQATRRSFVIMDEVGRGTTPEDGVAVGYACLKYLHDKIGCRALFATHFHALTDMTRHMEKLTYWCTDVEEGSDGGWSYNHRLRRGVNRRSHALKVAALAGLPSEAIETAGEVLKTLEGRHALDQSEDQWSQAEESARLGGGTVASQKRVAAFG